jgi:hypothetical protein
MMKATHQLVLILERQCSPVWPPHRHCFCVIHPLNQLPSLLASWEYFLDHGKQHVLVDFVVVLDTATAGASLPVGVVSVGFRVRGDSASLPLALALLGFVQGLRANIPLRTRSVLMLNPVLGMNKGTVLAIVTQ